LWIKAAYSIAFKITEENKLNTSKRLNLAEQTWSKLAKHFSILLSDVDTKDLTQMNSLIETWKTNITDTQTDIKEKEKNVQLSLRKLHSDITDFRRFFMSTAGSNSNFSSKSINEKEIVPIPDKSKTIEIQARLLSILELVTKEVDNFMGDSTLDIEDKLKKCDRVLFDWQQLWRRLTNRHKKGTNETINSGHDEKLSDAPLEILHKNIKNLHEQYRVRIYGENGVNRNLTNLNGSIDVWNHKLIQQLSPNAIKSSSTISEADWVMLLSSCDEWIEYVNRADSCVGLSFKEREETQILIETNEKK
jgi:hypothetical protein